jgi:hypothetical protein
MERQGKEDGVVGGVDHKGRPDASRDLAQPGEQEARNEKRNEVWRVKVISGEDRVVNGMAQGAQRLRNASKSKPRHMIQPMAKVRNWASRFGGFTSD